MSYRPCADDNVQVGGLPLPQHRLDRRAEADVAEDEFGNKTRVGVTMQGTEDGQARCQWGQDSAERRCLFVEQGDDDEDEGEDIAFNDAPRDGTGPFSEWAKRPRWQRKFVYASVLAVTCAALAVCVFSSGSQAGLVSDRGIFDAPQFTQMLWEQTIPVLGDTVDHDVLKGHITNTITHVKSMANRDLPKNQAEVLNNAKLTDRQWSDMQGMAHGAQHEKVQAAGRLALHVLKNNLFSSPQVVAAKLKEALRPHARELIQLRSELIPPHMDIALGAWAKNHNETHAAWKGLLNTPATLDRLREAPSSAGRRLQDKLGIGGAPVGILSVVLVAIGEILVHVDMFTPGFNLPEWAWKLILTPMEVVSALACTNGANAYCRTIMGALGLNVMDAAFVLFCQVNLFGSAASNVCVNDIHSSREQEEMVDSLSHALGGPDIFEHQADQPPPARLLQRVR